MIPPFINVNARGKVSGFASEEAKIKNREVYGGETVAP